MRTALFAAALLASGAAFAQTSDPGMSTTATPPAPATSPVVMPDNSAPRVDNNGNTVISDPAHAPAGFNQAPGMNGVGGPYVDPSQPPAPEAATSDYPPCSRTVTDHCTQTYERGVGGGHAVRHRRHHR
jgi:hypothetical protein